EDFLKVDNWSQDSNIQFNVYAYDTKSCKWFVFGVARLKGFNDTCTIFNGHDVDLEDLRYFAVEPQGEKDYAYSVITSRDDLRIRVLDAGSGAAEGASIEDDSFLN
ncbi:MAG: hypothetical protein K2H09_02880, partial [Treponemataceae bacterium]|nr:hypothetical protein [Treponemataceae bacterium]